MAIVTDLPEDATVIDLDAARKARAEARAESAAPDTYIKLAAGYVPVKAEFSLSVIEHLRKGEVADALAALLTDPADADVLIADGVSAQDINVIMAFVGSSLGEASAS